MLGIRMKRLISPSNQTTHQILNQALQACNRRWHHCKLLRDSFIMLVLLNLVKHFCAENGAMPFCQPAIMPTCHFVTLPFSQPDILPPCHFVTLPFCHLAILSPCHFVTLPFCHLAILSPCHFVTLPFCHLKIYQCTFS